MITSRSNNHADKKQTKKCRLKLFPLKFLYTKDCADYRRDPQQQLREKTEKGDLSLSINYSFFKVCLVKITFLPCILCI